MTDLKNTIAVKAASQGQDVQAPRQSISQFIDSMTGQIARALPKHMSPERIARIALTEVRRNPELGTASSESFGGALMTCAQLGLEPGGAAGEAYLLPFKRKDKDSGKYFTEVQLVIGYQGMVKLFWQHPLAAGLDAHVVRENDLFEYEYGLNPVLRHRPARSNRGEAVEYYAVARMTNGGSAFVVLPKEEINRIRQRSKSKDFGPWASDYDAMAKKTCIRQLFKLLPKSAELSAALVHDESVRVDVKAESIEEVPTPALESAPLSLEQREADQRWLSGEGGVQ